MKLLLGSVSSAFVMATMCAACAPDRGNGTPGKADLSASSPLDFASGQFDFASSNADLTQVSADVHVVLTADNAYAFGWGDVNQVLSLKGRPPTASAGDIFNCPLGTGPEAYDVLGADAPSSGYLYIVTWADNSVTQGVIGQFTRGGTPLYTGDTAWEACATGLPYDPSTGSSTANGPTQMVVNTQIGNCNAGTISTTTGSGGWVNSTAAVTAGAVGKLAIGEDNSDNAGSFPIVCQKDGAGKQGVDAAAHWMWYAPPGVTDPFHASGTNNTRAFLIFRLKSADVPIL